MKGGRGRTREDSCAPDEYLCTVRDRAKVQARLSYDLGLKFITL